MLSLCYIVRSNVIILVTYRIAKNLKSLDIKDEYIYYLVTIIIVSSSMAVANAIAFDNEGVDYTYLSLRSISIIFNIALFLLIMQKLYVLLHEPIPEKIRHSKDETAATTHQDNPVYVLVMRLQYYCIVQTISRLGASWYQLQYGFNADSYDSNRDSTIHNVSLVSAITNLLLALPYSLSLVFR